MIPERVKVSVLITTYNIDKYISGAIDSVLMQEGIGEEFDLEILIGDDGSDDKTVDVINSYRQKYSEMIHLYQMPREKGVNYNRVERSSANRINLLKNASGKYICFLDGDDFYIDKQKLKKQISVLESNDKLSICTHNVVMYAGEDTPIESKIEKSKIEELMSGQRLSRAKHNHIWKISDYWPVEFIQANAMMFRNVYANGNARFNVSLKAILEDNEALKNNFDDNNITISFFMYGDMYYFSDIMGAYRQVSGSSWNAINELKKHCSNMIGASIEADLINRYKESGLADTLSYSYARHSKDYSYIKEHMEELSREKCEPFYSTAEKYNIKFALSVYKLGETDERKGIFCGIEKRARKYYFIAKCKRALKKMFGMY